ncbi:unnamed protein product [Rotaria sordida]|uniref:Uncharacterized protein n=2 Tax=Rotaria sordida TaxID=392033 RepID=A0A814AJT9_9BILA|nr:unnamed protein product [Rotaria sordida]CAF1171392.1 unnamed protein product [Rotaria sordida]
MRVSNISRVPKLPKIRRMSLREIQATQIANDFNYPSTTSANKWATRGQNQVAPEIHNSISSNAELPRDLRNNEQQKSFFRRPWFLIFAAIFCFILIIAIVAIVLASTHNDTATQKSAIVKSEISTSMICSSTDHGLIAILNRSSPSGWISYSYNYSAIKTTPTLLFGFETDNMHRFYLDTVSVVDNNVSSIELLTNPSFENSTMNILGWITSCETTCASQIVSGLECSGLSGNCFMVYCNTSNSSISFLSQSFMATIGNTYTISFMLNHVGNPSTGIMSFYLDVN